MASGVQPGMPIAPHRWIKGDYDNGDYCPDCGAREWKDGPEPCALRDDPNYQTVAAVLEEPPLPFGVCPASLE